jgi:hypothetical protein
MPFDDERDQDDGKGIKQRGRRPGRPIAIPVKSRADLFCPKLDFRIEPIKLVIRVLPESLTITAVGIKRVDRRESSNADRHKDQNAHKARRLEPYRF